MAPRGSTVSLERLPEALEAAVADGDDVEARFERRGLGMCREPGLGRSPPPPLLLARAHLERVPPPRSAFCLHLDERQAPAAAHDQVELVAAGPRVAVE